jgi:catechol 2,3-dioxygenase-like lactoylglutathione lyase family enzyme
VRRPARTPIIVAGLALWLLVALHVALSRPAADAPPVRAVESIGMTVADMDRSVAFYSRALACDKVSDVEVAGEAYARLQGVAGLRARVVRLRLGDEELELTQYLTAPGRPIPGDSRSDDRWFQHVAIIVSDMDLAYRWLRALKVEHVSPAPQRLPDWNPVAGGIRAFYFKDPDGHVLEILEFPPGKGSPKWHQSADRLFMGVDHTAIVVADTERSLEFYHGRLGLSIAGRSDNHGPEQERLNNVPGARLRITTLRAGAGPGIELLEYVTPRDGRPFPAEARASDLVHWQPRLASDDVAAALRRLGRGPLVLVSPGVVTLADPKLGFPAGALLRDPDGHALQLVAR